MNWRGRDVRFWCLTSLFWAVAPLRPEPLCVEIPRSAASTPYWSVCWLPDGSLIAGTNQLVEFAGGELRTEPAPKLSALRALLPLNGTQLLVAGVGGVTRFDHKTGVWRMDPTPIPQKPASEIRDTRLSDDGTSLVLATVTGIQCVNGNV